MTNKRIIATKRGGPEVLSLIEEDLPNPGQAQVRVKITAAGVSFADVLMREGVYIGMPSFPFTPGYDIVGIVDAIGEGVNNVSVGQTVAALTKIGGYSQYIVLTESELIRVPEEVDQAEAVSLILNYVTAYQMLYRSAKVKEGNSVLVHGAAGGVGTALLQLGKLLNLKMYGTVSSQKQESVRELGGIPIDYKQEDFVRRVRELSPYGVDDVFEGTGSLAHRSYKILNKNGKLILFGISSMLKNGIRSIPSVIATYLRLSIFLKNFLPGRKKVLLYQITGLKKSNPEWFKEDVAMLFGLLKQGKIKPVIATKLPLSQAAVAHQMLNSSSVAGKIVLLCQE